MSTLLVALALGVAGETAWRPSGGGLVEEAQYAVARWQLQTDLEALVEGTWLYRPDAATRIRIRIAVSARDVDPENPTALAQRSLITSAHACGNVVLRKRSVIAPAGACMDAYVLPLDVDIIAGAPSARMQGVVTAHDPSLQVAVVQIKVGASMLSFNLGDPAPAAYLDGAALPDGAIRRLGRNGS
jgi:hypothetical protein